MAKDTVKKSKETVRTYEAPTEENIKETVRGASRKPKETVACVEESDKPKKKGKGNPKAYLNARNAKSPVIGMNGFNLKPGDNSKYVGFNMLLFKLPSIDLNNPEQVEERLNLYFSLCFENDMKPTVSGMAMCLDWNRQQLWSLVTGTPNGKRNQNPPQLPSSSTVIIKKAYNFMQNLWEEYMQNGKINPVAGIFLGKNNYGYVDKTETTITTGVADETEVNRDEILARYKLVDGDGE